MGVDVGGKDFGGQEKTSANATFGEWGQAVDSQGRGSQRGKWQSREKEGHRTWGLAARLAATNHKGRIGERGRWGHSLHKLSQKRSWLRFIEGNRAGGARGKGTIGGRREKGRGQGHWRVCF